MLTEQILLAHLGDTPALDAFDLHTYKHVSTFKRSSTARSGLAVTDSHIYAAQEGKALVNVYNRQKQTLEYTAPFSEPFTVLEASHSGAFIAGGTENGRLTIWEVASGRFISTGHTHLQRVTNIVFDPSDNFILTGSPDANVAVWSVPTLLDFASERKPERVLDHHQREITSIACSKVSGPTNFAIVASRDLTCIAWNYQTGSVLRRFIFPLSPLTLALDPADRAFYVGFEDGTVQCIDLHSANGDAFASQLSTNKLFVEESRNVPVTVTGDGSSADERARWVSAGHDSAVTAISVMYEGNFIVTGNEKGEVCVWDVATGSLFRKIVQRKSPITAMKLLPPTGFLYPSSSQPPRTTFQPTSTKPRFDTVLSSTSNTSSTLPESYLISTQFISPLTTPASAFLSREEEMNMITEGHREMTVGTGNGAGDSARVKQLEEELARVYDHYERLAGLHRGLWEKQARLLLEGGGEAEGKRGKRKAEEDGMEE